MAQDVKGAALGKGDVAGWISMLLASPDAGSLHAGLTAARVAELLGLDEGS